MKIDGLKIAAGVLVALVAVVGGSTLVGSEENKPVPYTAVRELPARKTAVTAVELWNETLVAARCFEEHGERTVGPFPSVDGSQVEMLYTAQRNSAADKTCNTPLMPLQMRYALDESKAEAENLKAIRAQLEDCIRAEGVELAPAPSGPKTQPDRANGQAPEINANGPIQAAAMANPEIVRACADSLVP